ncbi:hypothetical protein [Yinghuangia sp. YIM S10712]|uniref:hypothetical protein n=1 Tax=Yinghuangia sp. YIM S10712 TaxID=3436930 RepID=UPI003F53138B
MEDRCGGEGEAGDPGQRGEKGAGFVEVLGEGGVDEDAGCAVAGEGVGPAGRGGAEHGALFDAQVEKGDQKGDQDAADAAEDGADDDAEQGVGGGDHPAGGNVPAPLPGIEDGGGGR